MDFQRLNEKKKIVEKGRPSIDKITLFSYEKDFELTYTHNSTAIEGNTLTLLDREYYSGRDLS